MMQAAQIVSLGLTHHSTPVAIREQLRCSLEDVQTKLSFEADADGHQEGAVRELVLVRTCNRVELYAMATGENAQIKEAVLGLLSGLHEFDISLLEPYLQFHTGLEAGEHLLRVAAGLDSLVLGEPQILGQIIDAYQAAVKAHLIGSHLTALFRAAIRTGKRVRTETRIASNPVSVGSMAVAQAREAAGDLFDKQILLVGLGEMNTLVLKALRSRGINRIAVANRTVSRAARAVAPWCGQAFSLADLPQALKEADVIISAAAAPAPIITAELVRNALPDRAGRTLLLLDIAVPRNIEPAVGEIAGVQVFDIDHLQISLDSALAARECEVPRAEAIIAEELAALDIQLQELVLRPVIVELRKKAEAIRQRQLSRTIRHLGEIEPEIEEQLHLLSRSLVNKLLHEPTIRLKSQATNGDSAEYAATVQDLFGLEVDSGS